MPLFCMKMKLVLGLLCLALLLDVYSSSPVNLAEDTRKTVDLSYICLHTVPYQKEKAPILLLHGLFGFKETWYSLMMLFALETGRKVCAADLRNNGDSPWSDEFDTIIMAKDIERLLERLKFEKVIILGHSLGGKIGVQFTLTNPEIVEKLIVEDMRPNSFRKNPDIKSESLLKDIAEAALKAIPEGATESEAKRTVYNVLVEESKKVNETLYWDDRVVENIPIRYRDGKWTWKSNIDVLDKAMFNITSTMPESHGRFDGPALFIYGGKSPGRVGEAKEEILELFPNAKLFEVKNASHMVHIYPEYKEEVLKFILN